MAIIRQTFFQECDEQLVELEAGLLSIEAGTHDDETVNAVFRAVHSIKGGAGAFNLPDLVHFAHGFENTLDAVRTSKIGATPPLLKTMLRATDFLNDLVRVSRDGLPHDAARSQMLSVELASFLPGAAATPRPVAAAATPVAAPVAAAPAEDEFVFVPTMVDLNDFADLMEPATTGYRIRFKPRPEFYAKGSETAILFREVERLGTLTVRCDASDLPGFDALDPEGAYLAWDLELNGGADIAAVREIFEFVEWDSDFSIEPIDPPPAAMALDADAVLPAVHDDLEPAVPEELAAPVAAAAQTSGASAAASDASHKAARSATIRVELDRVDRLINLAGELVINQAMLNEQSVDMGQSKRSAVSNGLDELEQLTRDIQESVMAIRAQPVRSVFQRLPRLVRELAAQTNKSVRLVTEGEGTEVDKIVIEHLGDPLTHMIRNAIDHGIEDARTRQERGKPPEACVKVSAVHRSGRIIIEVSDDGGGINRPRVRQIAEDKGLIAKDAPLTDEEIDNLIFLPGFSTAAEVSDISGRGVGMDVVRREIQSLGGRISISSRPGEGSTFILSLPLTLAVLDGMALSVAGQTFVVPLSAVIEILMPQVVQVHGFNEQGKVIGLRNGFLPLVDVGQRLGIRYEAIDPKDGIVLLLETDGGERMGLVVDAIQGQRQVVMKSLETNYGKVPGIAAATILGDGRVALILDVDAMAPGRPSVLTFSDRVPLRSGAPMTSNQKIPPRELVTFLIGRHEFCVDIMAVREIRGWTPATSLPHSPDYVRGVINLRGAVLSIIDLATRLGLPAQEPTARHVIIVVEVCGQLTGLLVDAVTGILSLEGHTILPPPAAAALGSESAVEGVLAIEDRMLSLIQLENVMPFGERMAA